MKDGKLKWDLGFFEERDFGLRKSESLVAVFWGERKREGESDRRVREKQMGGRSQSEGERVRGTSFQRERVVRWQERLREHPDGCAVGESSFKRGG